MPQPLPWRCGDRSDSLREQYFRAEFLGRLDKVIRFEELTAPVMRAIAGKYLEQLRQRTCAQGTALSYPEDLGENLCLRCRGRGGARQLRRLVQSEVEGPLAEYLLRCGRKPGKLRAVLEEGRITFRTHFDRTDVQK